MHFRRGWPLVLVVGCLFAFQSVRAAPNPNVKLEYQVAALETLQQFNLSPDQLRAIQKLVSNVKPATMPNRAKISDEYRNALSGGDEDKIADAEDKVGEIRDKDENATEPDIDATDSARDAAPKLLAIL